MYSKHSALGNRILGINRNNNAISPLETKMASSWQKCREKERYFVEQRRHFTVNFTRKGEKEAVEAVVEGENSNKLSNEYHAENPNFRTRPELAEGKWKTRI